jgi:uncharacterized protein with PQ loop repeat
MLEHRHQSLRRKGIIKSPARNPRLVRAIDILAFTASMLSLLFTTDQVRLIWIEHDTSGVSALAWAFYTCSSSVWFFYGYIHRDRVIFTTNMLWILMNGLVVVGILTQ